MGNKHKRQKQKHQHNLYIYFNVGCGVPAFAEFDVFVLKIKKHKN